MLKRKLVAIGRSLRSMATTTKTPPVLLCADFDETITQRDTTALLFQLASSSAATQQQLVEQYVDEVGGYLRRHEAKWLQRQTTGEFDGDGLREFLEGYAATDLRSLQRVVETRALRGIKQTHLVEAAESVQVRAGCVETLAIADRLAVISANWSGELVRTVLQRSGIATQSTEIIANELKMDAHGVATGEIEVKVQSPMDKARRVAELRAMHAEVQPTVVFVGDSTNDLLALLEADVGVWLAPDMTSSSSALLQQLVDLYGIDVLPLTNYSTLADSIGAASDKHQGDYKPTFFTTTDWSHLRAIVRAQVQNGHT